MAEQFAVYSEDKDVTSLAQVLALGKALTVPWFQFTFAGGTTETIPDAGNVAPEAADKVVFYETGISGGSGSRTLNLPETPVEGQILVIKDLNAGTSPLHIRRFDSSDSVDGGAQYTLTNDNQSVMLRPALVSPGVWYWSILAEYKPYSVLTQMQWGGTYTASALPAPPAQISLPVGFVSPGGTPPSTLQYGMVVNAGTVTEFVVRLMANTLDAGDSFTIKLRKGGADQMSLGPYSGSTATGVYSTASAPFSVAQGDLLDVVVVYSVLAGTGNLNLIAACPVTY